MLFDFDAERNTCNIGERVELKGRIKGQNNTVVIESPVHECRIDLRISGDNNKVHILAPFAVKGLNIHIGNHVPAHQVKLDIAEGFSIEGGGNFFLYNSGNILQIGAKRFEEEHVVLAGNPAKVVRRNAQWIRNHSHLPPASTFAENHRTHKEQFMIKKSKIMIRRCCINRCPAPGKLAA